MVAFTHYLLCAHVYTSEKWGETSILKEENVEHG
jgi:hypothetical protein